MVILPLSKGCRNDSKEARENSGSSSKNSTPLCAKDISPGTGFEPPPAKAAEVAVWCGALNGGFLLVLSSVSLLPTKEWTHNTSK